MPPRKKKASPSGFPYQGWRATISSGVGCPFCNKDCCLRLKPQEEQILKYRETFDSLAKETQERELLWIFSSALGRGCDGSIF